jgi:MFS family permease
MDATNAATASKAQERKPGQPRPISTASTTTTPARLVHYVSGALLVRGADEGARVALVLLAIERVTDAGSPAAAAGFLVAALLVPHVVASPLVGAAVDRCPRPFRLIALAVGVFASALAVAGAGVRTLPLPVVVVVLLLGGCCGPALTGALTSRLPDLVAAERLPRAFGFDSLVYGVAGIGGPAVAAAISALASPRAAVLALAGGAGIGGLVLSTLPAAGRRPVRTTSTASRGAPATAGLRAIVRDRTLAAVTGATVLDAVGAGALPVVAAVLARRAHVPAAGGWLVAATAVGSMIGSLAWTSRPASPRRAPAVVLVGLGGAGLLTAVTAGVSVVLLGSLGPSDAAAAAPSSGGGGSASGGLVVLAVLLAFSGLVAGPVAGATFMTRQRHSRDDLRAQVFALGAGLKISASALGAAAAGLLASVDGAGQLAAIAACSLGGAALGAAVLSSGRRSVARVGAKRATVSS